MLKKSFFIFLSILFLLLGELNFAYAESDSLSVRTAKEKITAHASVRGYSLEDSVATIVSGPEAKSMIQDNYPIGYFTPMELDKKTMKYLNDPSIKVVYINLANTPNNPPGLIYIAFNENHPIATLYGSESAIVDLGLSFPQDNECYQGADCPKRTSGWSKGEGCPGCSLSKHLDCYACFNSTANPFNNFPTHPNDNNLIFSLMSNETLPGWNEWANHYHNN